MATSDDKIAPFLSVVIPVYNEEATLGEVVRKVLAVPHLLEVVVVDDASTDGTARVARQLAEAHAARVRVARHARNSGKTEALKTGFEMTRGEVVVVQDADLEYDPAEIPALVQPILDGHADVVYGSRFMVRKEARVLYYYHYLMNRFLVTVSNLLTNLNMTDVMTGYKAFRGEIIRQMVITSRGFGFEVEATAKVAKLKCAVYEVPISYYGRTYEQGKKIGARDGVAALWYIIRYNLLCGERASFRRRPPVREPALNRPAGPFPEEKATATYR